MKGPSLQRYRHGHNKFRIKRVNHLQESISMGHLDMNICSHFGLYQKLSDLK